MTAAWSVAWFGGAGDHHVRVADRLDLLEAVPLGERVETAEDIVEHGHHAGRRLLGREWREVDDVGEQDRHLVVVVGDDPFSGFQPIGDRARQDVEQQGVGLRLGAETLTVDEHDQDERDRRWDDEIHRPHQDPHERRFRRRGSDERIDEDARRDDDDHPAQGEWAGSRAEEEHRTRSGRG